MSFRIGELVDGPDGVFVAIAEPTPVEDWIKEHPIGSRIVGTTTGNVYRFITLPFWFQLERTTPEQKEHSGYHVGWEGALLRIPPVQTVIRVLSPDEFAALAIEDGLLYTAGVGEFRIIAEVIVAEKPMQTACQVRINRIIWKGSGEDIADVNEGANSSPAGRNSPAGRGIHGLARSIWTKKDSSKSLPRAQLSSSEMALAISSKPASSLSMNWTRLGRSLPPTGGQSPAMG